MLEIEAFTLHVWLLLESWGFELGSLCLCHTGFYPLSYLPSSDFLLYLVVDESDITDFEAWESGPKWPCCWCVKIRRPSYRRAQPKRYPRVCPSTKYLTWMLVPRFIVDVLYQYPGLSVRGRNKSWWLLSIALEGYRSLVWGSHSQTLQAGGAGSPSRHPLELALSRDASVISFSPSWTLSSKTPLPGLPTARSSVKHLIWGSRWVICEWPWGAPISFCLYLNSYIKY